MNNEPIDSHDIFLADMLKQKGSGDRMDGPRRTNPFWQVGRLVNCMGYDLRVLLMIRHQVVVKCS